MNQITIHSIFINQNHYIDNIYTEDCDCTVKDKESFVTQESLMGITKQKNALIRIITKISAS